MLRTLALVTLAAWALLPLAGSAPLYDRILSGEDYPLLVFTAGWQVAAALAIVLAVLLTVRAPRRPDARALAWTLVFFAVAFTAFYPSYFFPPLRAELMAVPVIGRALRVLHDLAFGLTWVAFVRFSVLFPRPLPAGELTRVTNGRLAATRTSWERVFAPVDAAFYRLARLLGVRGSRDDASPVLEPRDAARVARFTDWTRSPWPERLAWGTAAAVLALELLPWSGWPRSLGGILAVAFTGLFMLASLAGGLVLRLAHAATDGDERRRAAWVVEAPFSFLWVVLALLPVSIGLAVFDAPDVARDAATAAFAPAVALWALVCIGAAVAAGAFSGDVATAASPAGGEVYAPPPAP